MSSSLGAAAPLTAERRQQLHRRVRMIVAVVIGYNVVEAVVALIAGHVASSGALISFGLDSIVEVLSAAAIAWQFAGHDPRARERIALRTVSVAFFALAAYVTVQSVRTLIGGADAEPSPVGIALAAVSLVVMPVLSLLERRTGRALGSRSVVADSKQTLICSALSAVLLVGLVVNTVLGWSWADPVAAMVVALVAVREGVAAWRGDACCASPEALLADRTSEESSDCSCC